MRTLSLILTLAAVAMGGCNRDQAVPTAADNQAMDAASDRLDRAPEELNRVDQRLPETDNQVQPRA